MRRIQCSNTNSWQICIRRYLSTSQSFNTEYDRVILKKFIFQIHPDFFQRYKIEQSINAENIKTLMSKVDSDKIAGAIPASTRSLIFFIKPGDLDSNPRRVKVTLSRIIESMREVLETLGIELPPRPEGSHSTSEFVSTVGKDDFRLFTESLIDRRELISWRTERQQRLQHLRRLVYESLGVKTIEFRHSWSAQNNSMLLHTLLRLIEENKNDLNIPWTGLDLILTFDDASFLPVDALERQVTINPCHLPAQWLHVFHNITPAILTLASSTDSLMKQLTNQFVNDAAILIRRRIQKSAELHSAINKQEADSEINGEMHRRLKNISVNIRNGFTCSKRKYLEFLQNLTTSNALTVYLHAAGLADDPDLTTNVQTNEQTWASISSVEGNSNIEATQDRALVVVDWVANMPVEVTIVVEEGYGTKLLPSGEIRIDCRKSPQNVWLLLDGKGVESVFIAAKIKRTQNKILELISSMNRLIGTIEIDKGVGVDQEMLNRCLEHLHDFANESDSNLSQLQRLKGLNIRVGMYLGIADDGACIIPWDITLF